MRGILWFLLGALVVTVGLTIFAGVLFLAAFLFVTSGEIISSGNGWGWLVAFVALFVVVIGFGGIAAFIRGVLFYW